MERVYKQLNNKITSSSGIYKTLYHNASYLRLFGKENDKILKSHMSSFSYFEIKASFF